MPNNINLVSGINTNRLEIKPKTDIENQNQVQFSDFLKNAVNDVANDVKKADELSRQLVTGDVKDLHQVMIAAEKAQLGIQLTVQVRNKVVEAYQEVMRMQV